MELKFVCRGNFMIMLISIMVLKVKSAEKLIESDDVIILRAMKM